MYSAYIVVSIDTKVYQQHQGTYIAYIHLRELVVDVLTCLEHRRVIAIEQWLLRFIRSAFTMTALAHPLLIFNFKIITDT